MSRAQSAASTQYRAKRRSRQKARETGEIAGAIQSKRVMQMQGPPLEPVHGLADGGGGILAP